MNARVSDLGRYVPTRPGWLDTTGQVEHCEGPGAGPHSEGPPVDVSPADGTMSNWAGAPVTPSKKPKEIPSRRDASLSHLGSCRAYGALSTQSNEAPWSSVESSNTRKDARTRRWGHPC